MHTVHIMNIEERERERRRGFNQLRSIAMLFDIYAILQHSSRVVPICSALALAAVSTPGFETLASYAHAVAPGALVGLAVGARQRAVELVAPGRRQPYFLRYGLLLQGLEELIRRKGPNFMYSVPQGFWSPFSYHKRLRRVATLVLSLIATIAI